jgi:hypothetical protein
MSHRRSNYSSPSLRATMGSSDGERELADEVDEKGAERLVLVLSLRSNHEML